MEGVGQFPVPAGIEGQRNNKSTSSARKSTKATGVFQERGSRSRRTNPVTGGLQRQASPITSNDRNVDSIQLWNRPPGAVVMRRFQYSMIYIMLGIVYCTLVLVMLPLFNKEYDKHCSCVRV